MMIQQLANAPRWLTTESEVLAEDVNEHIALGVFLGLLERAGLLEAQSLLYYM